MEYSVTAICPKILDTLAVAHIQADVFHHPANHPKIRPYLGPGVTEAQWYIPALLGIEEASSCGTCQRGIRKEVGVFKLQSMQLQNHRKLRQL